MASTSEVGHAKNVAHFHDLIAFCTGYGNQYSPSNANLKISRLQSLETEANASIQDIIPKRTAYNTAINERIQAFDGLAVLSTKVVNALDAAGASKQKVDDAKTYNKKIQGGGKKKEKPVDPNQIAPATISSSQQSYDQLIQHFSGLISVLESEPSYSPAETELQINTLNDKLSQMIAKNAALAAAYTDLDNKRIARDQVLYNPETGLVDVAADVKKYIKSIFGATSPQYRQVSALKFTKVK